MMDNSARPLAFERPRLVEWMDTLPASFRSEAFAEDLADDEPPAPTRLRMPTWRVPVVAKLLAVTWAYLRPALRA